MIVDCATLGGNEELPSTSKVQESTIPTSFLGGTIPPLTMERLLDLQEEEAEAGGKIDTEQKEKRGWKLDTNTILKFST